MNTYIPVEFVTDNQEVVGTAECSLAFDQWRDGEIGALRNIRLQQGHLSNWLNMRPHGVKLPGIPVTASFTVDAQASIVEAVFRVGQYHPKKLVQGPGFVVQDVN